MPAPEAGESPSPRDRGSLRVIRRLLWIVTVIAVGATLYFAAAVFVPLVTALLVSLLFKPVIHRLEAWHIAPPVSALLIVGSLFLVLVGVVSVGSQSAQAWLDDLPHTVAELDTSFRDVRARFKQMSEATERLSAIADGTGEASGDGEAAIEADQPVPVEVRGSGMPGVVLNSTSRIVAGIVVTLVMSFFMLASGDLLLRQLVQALPALAQKRDAVEAWRDVERHVSAYLVTVTGINIALGLAVWGVLWWLGLPYAMWWGAAATLSNFIPYVGPLVVAVGLFLAAVLAFDSLGQAALAVLCFVTLTSLEGYIVTPVVLGRRLSLNPLVLFVWLVFWGWLWGVPGALLAVPMLVCFKIVCEHVGALETIANVLSGYVGRAGENQGDG